MLDDIINKEDAYKLLHEIRTLREHYSHAHDVLGHTQYLMTNYACMKIHQGLHIQRDEIEQYELELKQTDKQLYFDFSSNDLRIQLDYFL